MDPLAAADMLNNGTASRGFIADILGQRSQTELVVLATILASAFVLPLLIKLLTPTMDPREPPLIKPSIPLIGHILGIITKKNDYLRAVHNAHPSKPLVTLQMLNGKLYSVFDAHMIQALLRNKTASFDPFIYDFTQKIFNLDAETSTKLFSTPDTIAAMTDVIHASFQQAGLQNMNAQFLGSIAEKMSPISQGRAVVDGENSGVETVLEGGGLQVENLFLWFRDVMSLATSEALFGDHDPFRADRSLIELTWVFEAAIPSFLVAPFPSLTIPTAHHARKTLQAAFSKYYSAGHDMHDPSASTLVRNRANFLRGYNLTADQIGYTEIILPVAATINAVPTLLWMFRFIFDRSELVQRLREEIEAAAEVGEKSVTLHVNDFETKLPLLHNCYRETLRLTNHSVSNRRIMKDMTITSSEGQTYVLKKGVDIQLPAGVTHNDSSIWGANASVFNPDRFLQPETRDKTAEGVEADKKRKAGYMPFGGGRHLCPGRNLALAEILGFMSVLLLGFDIEPTGMQRFGDLKMQPPQLVSAVVKPELAGKGLGAKIRPRKGWEGVEWKFVC